jgi:hypothetical protein
MTVDPGTGLTILGGAMGSAKLIEKILGPTAEYLGGGLRDWTERSLKNVRRIFERAAERLGNGVDAPGAVPPKVLKGILEEGPFCDDDLAAEYYGGVLASSRSEVGRDDRGAALISLLGRLTNYEIRSHFYFYKAMRLLFEGLDVNIGVTEGRVQLRMFVPMDEYVAALEFSDQEDLAPILSHVMFGLSREALIEEGFYYGDADSLRGRYPQADRPGILVGPSALGVELFLWAHGQGHHAIHDFLDTDLQLVSSAPMPIGLGLRSTNFPERVLPATGPPTTPANIDAPSPDAA